jgi:hypothetical protein
MRFFSYRDSEENAREQNKRDRSQRWIAKNIRVRGVIFDVNTDSLREAKALEDGRVAWPVVTRSCSPRHNCTVHGSETANA